MLLSIHVTTRLPQNSTHLGTTGWDRGGRNIQGGKKKKKSLKLIRQIEWGDTFGTWGCVLAKEKGHQGCLMPWEEQEFGTPRAKMLGKIPEMLIHIFKSLRLFIASEVSKHKLDRAHSAPGCPPWLFLHPASPREGDLLSTLSPACHPLPLETKCSSHSDAAPAMWCPHCEVDLNI